MDKGHDRSYILLAIASAALLLLFLASVDAQVTEYANVTVNLFDYSGNPLYENNLYPKLEIYDANGTLLKSLTCEAATCRVLNLTVDSYSFKVYWRRVEVAYINKTLTTGENVVNITCNVRRVRIRAVDDEDRMIENVDISLFGPLPGYQNSYPFNTGEGEIVKLLPFGTYKLSSVVWQWKVDDKTFSVDVSPEDEVKYVVGAQGDFIKIPVKVAHSLTVAFYTLDGRELTGDEAEVLVEFKYRGDWMSILRNDLSSSNKVTLGPIPYGEYKFSLFWEERLLFSEKILVNESIYERLEDGLLKLKVSMYRSLIVRFIGAQGQPLKKMYVVLVAPYGENFTYTTDEGGKIRLANLTAGKYVAMLRWIAGYAEVELDLTPGKVQGHVVEVVVDFYEIKLKIYPKGSETLPENLHILFRCNEVLLLNESLKEERGVFEKTFSDLYSKAAYTLRIRYMGYTLYEKRVSVEAGSIEVEVELYDLTVRVLSRSNSTLSKARVVLKYPRGEIVERETSEGGECIFKHLIAGYGTYRLNVYWKNYLVGSFTLKDEDISKGKLDVKVNVYDLSFKVYNSLHNGLPNVEIKVYLRNSTSTVLLANVTTDPTGFAKLSNVPVPSGYDVIADVDYKNKFTVKGVVLEKPGKTKEITLDVLVEIFGIPLSTLETLALVSGTIVCSVGAYFFIRWYMFRKSVTHIFSEGRALSETYEREYPLGYETIEEYEEEKRNPLSRIWKKMRDRLRELLEGGEEEEYEEEYDIFG